MRTFLVKTAIRRSAAAGLILGGLGLLTAGTLRAGEPTALVQRQTVDSYLDLAQEGPGPDESAPLPPAEPAPPPTPDDPMQPDPARPAPERPGTADGCVPDGCGVCGEPAGPDCNHLQGLFDDPCGGNCFGDRGLTIGGWIAQGANWNPDYPRNRINGPVTFLDRANEYQLNQVYLFLQKEIDQDACEWQLGGRVDALFGTDYYYTQALGLELEQDGTQRWNSDDGPTRTFGANTGAMYGLAMPQLYAELGGQGWSVKAGHFYTIIGYEVVPAKENFFYSHAYTMQYGEPFTHTGVLVNRTLSDNWSASAGITNGWDSFDNTNDEHGFLGGIAWTSDDAATSLAFAIHTGDENSVTGTGNRTMYSIVYTRKLADNLTYVLQHDHGWQEDGFVDGGGRARDAEWYGINQYLFYDVSDTLRAGVRYEWFRDDDAVRVVTANGAFAANYQALTAGLNWTVADCMLLRPEVRWDWADNGARPYDNGSDGSQVLFAADLILTY